VHHQVDDVHKVANSYRNCNEYVSVTICILFFSGLSYRFRADRKLEPAEGVVVERAASVYILRLPIVNLEHADQYTVRATNVAGVSTAVATLRVAGNWLEHCIKQLDLRSC